MIIYTNDQAMSNPKICWETGIIWTTFLTGTGLTEMVDDKINNLQKKFVLTNDEILNEGE